MSEVQIHSNADSEGNLILGKFTSTDELAAAYKNLEAKLGQGFAQTPEESNQVTETDPTTASTGAGPDSVYGESLVNAVASAGLDINRVAEEWASEAGVSTQTREALDAAFGSSVVEAYFKGLEAQQRGVDSETEKTVQGITQAVGGDEAWNTIAQWAGGPNGPVEIVEAYNSALDRGDAVTLKALALTLKGSYEAANGSIRPVSVTSGQPTGQASTEGFRSRQEVMSAMQDPRYKTDAAYRQDVANRLAKTDGFSVS